MVSSNSDSVYNNNFNVNLNDSTTSSKCNLNIVTKLISSNKKIKVSVFYNSKHLNTFITRQYCLTN